MLKLGIICYIEFFFQNIFIMPNDNCVITNNLINKVSIEILLFIGNWLL